MFSPFFLADLMRYWNELAAEMLDAQARCLSGDPVSCFAPAAAAVQPLLPVVRASQEGQRQVFDAARQAQERFGRATDAMFGDHPVGEFFGPLLNGFRMALCSLLFSAETLADRRAGYLAAATGTARL